jgi:transposase-like protein
MNKSINLEQAAKKLKTMEEVQEYVKEMTKGLVQKILDEEMNQHLGYEKYSPQGRNSGNSRNGTSEKSIESSLGEMKIEVPRDRNSSFEPVLVKKHQSDISDFDQKIISMYARGMTTRDIQEHVKEIYGAEISPTFVSLVTDKVLKVAHEWQQRPLEEVYVVAYFDALFYKVRDGGKIVSKAVYTCLGIDTSGHKEILGIWISQSESATHWLGVANELKSRGVKDILITCIDGLKGLADAIETVFPKTDIQRCVVHMMRNSFKHVPHKHIKEFVADLKQVYTADSFVQAEYALSLLRDKWELKYSLAVKPWIDNWDHVSNFFKYPPQLRKLIYTTNALEAVHRQFRKVTKTRSILANDESLFKLLYLAISNIEKKWTMPIRGWQEIATQLHIIFDDRFMTF